MTTEFIIGLIIGWFITTMLSIIILCLCRRKDDDFFMDEKELDRRINEEFNKVERSEYLKDFEGVSDLSLFNYRHFPEFRYVRKK